MANLQPKRRLIVDSHVHMWKAATAERPWVPGASTAVAGAVHHRADSSNDG